jgi:hypothetical protein
MKRGEHVSKIVIAAQTDKIDTVGGLRKLLPNKAVADIRKALTTGAPLVDRVLFYNDHVEAAALGDTADPCRRPRRDGPRDALGEMNASACTRARR